MPHSIEETYDKVRKFVSLERELRLSRKGKVVMEVAPEKKEKGKISLDRMVPDKMVATRNKHFTLNHKEGSQWSRNLKLLGR